MTETEPDAAPDAAPALDPFALTGLELMQAIARGDLPPAPIAETLGMTGFGAEAGSVWVELQPEHRHYNPLGTMHGGVLSTLLDTAAACSVHTTLEPGQGYTSLDLTVKFLRPVTTDSGTLRTTGRVISRGRRTALAEAQVVDGQGRLVAHATSTCMIFS